MKNKKRYVLKNKKRFIISVIIILTVMFIALFSDISYGYREPCYKVLTLKSGDTLWDIAEQYKGNRDLRQFIYKIKELNGLEAGNLAEGEKIKIPLN